MIVDVLELKSLQEPFFETWEEALKSSVIELRVYDDYIAEVEAHLEAIQEPISCDVCGGNARQYSSQYWADIDFGKQLGLGQIRWFRLCESCGLQAKQEDDPRIIFMFRQWPINDQTWRNGFIQGYALEKEGWIGPER